MLVKLALIMICAHHWPSKHLNTHLQTHLPIITYTRWAQLPTITIYACRIVENKSEQCVMNSKLQSYLIIMSAVIQVPLPPTAWTSGSSSKKVSKVFDGSIIIHIGSAHFSERSTHYTS